MRRAALRTVRGIVSLRHPPVIGVFVWPRGMLYFQQRGMISCIFLPSLEKNYAFTPVRYLYRVVYAENGTQCTAPCWRYILTTAPFQRMEKYVQRAPLRSHALCPRCLGPLSTAGELSRAMCVGGQEPKARTSKISTATDSEKLNFCECFAGCLFSC